MLVKPRYYLDTNVYGGCFEPEYAAASRALFDAARAGQLVIVYSDLILHELGRAPEHVREILAQVPLASLKKALLTRDVVELSGEYFAAGALTSKHFADAFHVALATTARCDVLVSWNHRHLVNLYRIRRFNSVNLRTGYGMLEVRNPLEVAADDNA